jgi:hypothetical protein
MNMSFLTKGEIADIHDTARVAALIAFDELKEIQSLMQRADAIWRSLDSVTQQPLMDLHIENCNLAHCLRWGNTAVDSLIEAAEVSMAKATEADSSPSP